MDILAVVLRWFHILAGIFWVGFMFFFVFVYGIVMAGMHPDVQKTVTPSIIRRTIAWVTASVWTTYVTGVLLLGLVFHAGGIMFDAGSGWGGAAGGFVLAAFLMFGPYTLLCGTAAGRNGAFMALLGAGVSMAMLIGMTDLAGMSYRAAMIHLGTMYGTIMAANGLMVLVPAQRRMAAALESGEPPNPEAFARFQQRVRHNVYLVVPLLWTMVNQHTVVPGASSHWWFVGVLVVSWAVVTHLFRRSAPPQPA